MKKITGSLLAIIVLISFGSSNAQFSTVWMETFQHSHSPGFSNEGRKIAEDVSGNIFTLTDVTSDVDPFGVQGTSTYHYVTLIKYAAGGGVMNFIDVEVFSHATSGFNIISGFGLEVDAAGSVYVGYSSWNSTTGFDVKLAKYDNDLLLQWENTYPLSTADQGVDFKLHSSGTIYAIVKSTNINTTYSIIKSVPANGSAALVYSYINPNLALKSIALGASQTVYVGGYLIKGIQKLAYTASINISTGSINWQNSYKPRNVVGDCEVNMVTVGIDGNIYSIGNGNLGAQGIQVFVLKNLPSNAHVSFAVTLMGAGLDNRGLLINATESGWLYIGAISLSNKIPLVFRIPSNGIFTTPASLSFRPVPNAQYNSITGISLKSMKISSSKNIYITGGVTASGSSGSFTSGYLLKGSVVFGNVLVDAGGVSVEGGFDNNIEGVDISLDYSKTDVYWMRNFWDDAHNSEIVEVIDINVPSPLRLAMQNNSNIISIAPNPANERSIVRSDAAIKSIEVLDITGNRVFYTLVDDVQEVLNTSSLVPGIYFCKVQTADGESVRKLVIE